MRQAFKNVLCTIMDFKTHFLKGFVSFFCIISMMKIHYLKDVYRVRAKFTNITFSPV